LRIGLSIKRGSPNMGINIIIQKNNGILNRLYTLNNKKSRNIFNKIKKGQNPTPM
jgi:hypothetical protein